MAHKGKPSNEGSEPTSIGSPLTRHGDQDQAGCAGKAGTAMREEVIARRSASGHACLLHLVGAHTIEGPSPQDQFERLDN